MLINLIGPYTSMSNQNFTAFLGLVTVHFCWNRNLFALLIYIYLFLHWTNLPRDEWLDELLLVSLNLCKSSFNWHVWRYLSPSHGTRAWLIPTCAPVSHSGPVCIYWHVVFTFTLHWWHSFLDTALLGGIFDVMRYLQGVQMELGLWVNSRNDCKYWPFYEGLRTAEMSSIIVHILIIHKLRENVC